MQPLPPGLPPGVAMHALGFQQELAARIALSELLLSQQNGATGQPVSGQVSLVGQAPTVRVNRVAAVVAWFQIAFFLFRMGMIAAVLWVVWNLFSPY